MNGHGLAPVLPGRCGLPAVGAPFDGRADRRDGRGILTGEAVAAFVVRFVNAVHERQRHRACSMSAFFSTSGTYRIDPAGNSTPTARLPVGQWVSYETAVTSVPGPQTALARPQCGS
jgi:hypothetical protein